MLAGTALDTTAYRGAFVAALYLVASLTLICLVGIILLAVLNRDIPSELVVTVTTGMGFLVGSASTAAGRKP